MGSTHDTQLTSAEIANLWATYINNTMSVCILEYFTKTVEDEEIKPVIDDSLQLANEYIQTITTIFNSENIPIPQGFTEKDVNLNAPKLFTDIVLINFVKSMAKAGLGTYSIALSLSSRDDVRSLFRYCIETTTDMDEKSLQVLKNKGLYIRPPYILYENNLAKRQY
ncbi:DUF3231 family protein [Bacillus shivajii]|uniref:DUF3231 family protein n=1 Tax=Bacillus shivajii TaxID=1983719 RepID=UPI001CF96418|nr:DUF3231 family protein [Bacillus shivajii]UCZ53496.1 DUF3231 family protein [Bacillus shivajii]